jgi:hypothetical protein
MTNASSAVPHNEATNLAISPSLQPFLGRSNVPANHGVLRGETRRATGRPPVMCLFYAALVSPNIRSYR